MTETQFEVQLLETIAEAIGVRPIAAHPLPVGFGLAGFRVDLIDGDRVAVKAHRNQASRSHLETEAFMLRELAAHTELPVPAVRFASADLLIMSWIDNDGGAIGPAHERHAAELLAALHTTRLFSEFGYFRDTVIGPLHQPNTKMANWVAFFRDQRLLHMARQAHDARALPNDLFARLEGLAGDLERYLIEPDHPALIHGDLWTGNILLKDGRIAGLVDPALYCAHPEIELAFTTLFGTFGTAFFDAYASLAPLEADFQNVRRPIYNLYPALVHLSLFGPQYLPMIDGLLKEIGV